MTYEENKLHKTTGAFPYVFTIALNAVIIETMMFLVAAKHFLLFLFFYLFFGAGVMLKGKEAGKKCGHPNFSVYLHPLLNNKDDSSNWL